MDKLQTERVTVTKPVSANGQGNVTVLRYGHRNRYRIPSIIFVICALLFVTSGCARESAKDARQFPKGYFKDKVSISKGTSTGIGPSAKKITPEKVIDLGRRESKEYDFGDDTSATLTIKAWESLNQKDEKGVLFFAERCIQLYSEEAKAQASTLTDYASQTDINKYQQMNDVGTCYFIKGEFFKYNKDWKNSKESYQRLIDEFPFAQYWDPRGWYWKPAEIAKDEIRKINEGYYK